MRVEKKERPIERKKAVHNLWREQNRLIAVEIGAEGGGGWAAVVPAAPET
jgi:hypothetical protein